ncbi:preprotein translocase subunit SecG [bacterium]|nr:preprotein translocase subunit SecG [bacterium]
MEKFVLVIHVITCLLLMAVILMQSSKGDGLSGSAAFGGIGDGGAFRGREAVNFLQKSTMILAGLFLVTSLTLAFLSSTSRIETTDSVLQENLGTTQSTDQPAEAPGEGK